ncbi:MAG TPA: MgtC/SapB family protein [Candidatus Acidoferrales bacterium]|nr:MgtC/SapB family protein [Candidatus Acidoferrales bacterium]
MHDHVVAEPGFAVRLLVAGLLGAAIGFERQWRQRGAGLHTSALVAIGAALFALLGPVLGSASETRVLANIVTGVGFLAGGVILRQGTSVTGLNTAGTIWATAAVGAFAGVGLFWEATLGALAIATFNLCLQPMVMWVDGHAALFRERHGDKYYLLQVLSDDTVSESVRSDIVRAVEGSKLQLHSLASASTADGVEVNAEIFLLRRDDAVINALATALGQRAGVRKVNWKIVDSA